MMPLIVPTFPWEIVISSPFVFHLYLHLNINIKI